MQLDLSSVDIQETFTVYLITNLINKKIYIGAHKHHVKEKLKAYMGTSDYVSSDIIVFGIDSFSKEIIFAYDNEDEMYAKEGEIVDANFISREDTYNMILGGRHSPRTGCACYKRADGSGKNCLLPTDHPDVLNHIYVGITTGKAVYIKTDGSGERKHLPKDHPDVLNGLFISIHKNMVTVKDESGNTFAISKDDPDYKSKKLKGVTAGMGVFKDKNGNTICTSIDNPQIGHELIDATSGYKWSPELKIKNKEHNRGNRNSCFGRKWFYNDELQLKLYDRFTDKEIEKLLHNNWCPGINHERNNKGRKYYSSIKKSKLNFF